MQLRKQAMQNENDSLQSAMPICQLWSERRFILRP